jgi:hypothetical protein
LSPFLTAGRVGWKFEVDFNETDVVAALKVEALIGPLTCDDGATANEFVLVVIPAFDGDGVGELDGAEGVGDAVGVGVGVALALAVGVGVGVALALAEGVGVGDGETIGVGAGTNPPPPPPPDDPPPDDPLFEDPPLEDAAVIEKVRGTWVAAAKELFPA